MEVWRLSSKRLAAPTFIVRESPELPLPLTTDPDIIHGHKWRMCRRRSGAKTEKAVSGDCIYHRNRIHGKQKAVPTDGFTKIIWKKFFFLTIYLYPCNRLFELCKALYIIAEDRSPNQYLLHFITY